MLLNIFSPRKRNDEAEFRKLVEQNQRRLYWHLRRILNSHEDAEDVLQETFYKAYKSYSKFDGKCAVYTWLYRIATNEALRFMEKRGPEYELLDNIGDNIRSENDDTDEQLNEQRILLQKAIRTLPEKQKLVFNLRFYDEMEYEQICEILDISMSAAKTNFHLAKEKIKSYIQSQPL